MSLHPIASLKPMFSFKCFSTGSGCGHNLGVECFSDIRQGVPTTRASRKGVCEVAGPFGGTVWLSALNVLCVKGVCRGGAHGCLVADL